MYPYSDTLNIETLFLSKPTVYSAGSFELPRLSSLIIPIAISFFTFQAISYLVDVYRGTVEKVPFLDLAVFLSFFPHLVAGPIVRASEFIPQLRNPINPRTVEGTTSTYSYSKRSVQKNGNSRSALRSDCQACFRCAWNSQLIRLNYSHLRICSPALLRFFWLYGYCDRSSTTPWI